MTLIRFMMFFVPNEMNEERLIKTNVTGKRKAKNRKPFWNDELGQLWNDVCNVNCFIESL